MRKIISIICLIFIVSASILPVYADESRIIVSFEEQNGVSFKDLSIKSSTNELIFFGFGSGYGIDSWYAIAIEITGSYHFSNFNDGTRLLVHSDSGIVNYSTNVYYYNVTEEIWVISNTWSCSGSVEEGQSASIWTSNPNTSFKLKKSTVDILDSWLSSGVFSANFTLDNATVDDSSSDSTGIINAIVTWFAKAFDDLKDFFTSLFEPVFKHFEEQGLIFENSVGRLVLFLSLIHI